RRVSYGRAAVNRVLSAPGRLMRNNDSRLVNKVANDYVRRAGINAVPDLVEYAEIASSLGDDLSAAAWLDIAGAALTLLQAE
ncbi:MAG TPA: hypothetical protein VE087_06950, partial [Xanthobacteraceae bacterium]|nr:hypothetical protein [Xanthobacteraceae bacterium]